MYPQKAVSRDRADSGSWPLGMGLVEIGEYEEGLEVCRRGTELTRKLPNVATLWHNLDKLGRAYEELLDLEGARRVHEETLKLRRALGPHYEAWSFVRLCAVAALSEGWEEAYAHAKRAHEGRGPPSMYWIVSTSTMRSKRWCGEGTSDSPEKR